MVDEELVELELVLEKVEWLVQNETCIFQDRQFMHNRVAVILNSPFFQLKFVQDS